MFTDKGKNMINFQSKIFEKTGIMTKRQIVKTSKNIGQSLCDELHKTTFISNDRLSEFLAEKLQKRAENIKIIGAFDDFIKLAKNNLDISESTASSIYESTTAITIPRGKGEYSAVFIEPHKFNIPKEYANIAPHELTHALYREFSLSYFLFDKTKKLRLNLNKEHYEKIQSMSDKLNIICTEFQGKILSEVANFETNALGLLWQPNSVKGLVKQSGCANRKELHEKIRSVLIDSEILNGANERENLIILRKLENTLTEEKIAYIVGGGCEKYYFERETGMEYEKASKSELAAILYSEALKVVRKEKFITTQKMIKNFLENVLKNINCSLEKLKSKE